VDVLGSAALNDGPGEGVSGTPREAQRGDEVLREQLRERGLRVTAPRLLTYRTLAELGGHRSADEVYDAVVAGGGRLSRTSVYNALAALVVAGAVLGADAGPGRALFEASATWHHHVVCRVCGRVDDVACLTGEKPCLTADLGSWGTVDEAQVIFRGVCQACRTAAGPPLDGGELEP
jgi:Fe2+ or Zn2+ uptake regulation protein